MKMAYVVRNYEDVLSVHESREGAEKFISEYAYPFECVIQEIELKP